MTANNVQNSSRKHTKPDNASKQPSEQFIVEVERPGKKLNMPNIQKVLESTGIKLDLNYGPFCVNPKLGRYVVRGIGDAVSMEKVKNIPGVKLYKDTRIYPV